MVPVMATSGQFAMGGGNGSNTAKGKIKLPIFKLPAIDVSRVKSREQNRNMEKALQQGEKMEQRFIPYHDIPGYRKALVLMINSFGRRDTDVIKYFLRMTVADIEDLNTQLRKKYDFNGRKFAAKTSRSLLRMGTAESMSTKSSFESSHTDLSSYLMQQDQNSHAEGILDTLFREDPSMSVFVLAKDVTVLAKQEQVSEALGDQTEAIVYNKALRNITSKMDMSALGLSDNMMDFLTTGNVASQAPAKGTQEFDKLKSNMNAALGGFASALTKPHNNASAASITPEPSQTMRKIGSMPSLYSLHPPPRIEPSASQGLASAYRKNTVRTAATSKKKSMRLPPTHMSQTMDSFLPQLNPGGGSVYNSSSHRTINVGASKAEMAMGVGEYANSADLTTALISSLRTMQKHSNMVQRR
jgi:hypothetical protein